MKRIVVIMIGMLGVAVVPSRAALVGYWNFNEGSGTNALDASGNGNTGAIHGASYVTGPGGFGTALQFTPSSSNYVNVGVVPLLMLTNSNYTISWWIKWTGAGSELAQRIINMDDGLNNSGGYSMLLYPAANNFLYLVHNNGNYNNSYVVPSNYSPTAGVWMHVAVVWDGTTRTIYVNGMISGNASVTGGNLTSDGDDPLSFGCLINPGNPNGTQFFNGALDEIRLYNQALSAAEVVDLLSPTPLVGYWNFNEGSGTNALDSSGNSYTGAIYGAQYVSGPRSCFGSALHFTASASNYVKIADTLPLELVGSTNYSIACWIKWDGNDAQAAQRIVNMDDGENVSGGYSFLLLNLSLSKAIYDVHNTGSSSFGSFSAPTFVPTVDKWTHLALVRNGNGRLLYVNGISNGYFSAITGNLTSDGNDPLIVGGLQHTDGSMVQFFNGAIDEVHIYRKALSEAEIVRLFVGSQGTTFSFR